MKKIASAYPDQIQHLPIAPYLDSICMQLKSSLSHFLILTAETAAGKSTAVPLALLNYFSGHILMLEPRRLAVLAITNRISELLDESPGQTVGYRMHLESQVSGKTRIEIITEAILTRKLQSDPTLEGTDVVIIDEFHERSVHADLALALLKESMQLRNDLYVVVMSATIETEKTAAFLGTQGKPAPVFTVQGRQFPVTITYAGNISPAQAVLHELNISTNKDSTATGSILVFLPGIADIRRCASDLASAHVDADILLLHSSINFEEQRKVLQPPNRNSKRRVILSSAIAETSVTVPDVTTVIDSGLARINRMNLSAGMEQLVTERESVFSATQRTGRAGRTAPGKCIRLWNENDVRVAGILPEILRTDLIPLVLECAAWGVTKVNGLSWLDSPSQSAWIAAQTVLTYMGCLEPVIETTCIVKDIPPEPALHITQFGKEVLSLGLHPRLACAALTGLNSFSGISQTEVIKRSVHCVLKYSNYKNASSVLQKKFCTDLEYRLQNCIKSRCRTVATNKAGIKKDPSEIQACAVNQKNIAAAVLLAGFPDKLARRIDTGTYQFPSGRIAILPVAERTESGGFPEWIVVPEADAGERIGKIYSYEALSSDFAELWLTDRMQSRMEIMFTDGGKNIHKLCKTRYNCYGKLILSEKKIQPEPEDFITAVCDEVIQKGLSWLPISDKTTDFLLRAQFYVLQTKNDKIIPNTPDKEKTKNFLHNPQVDSLAASVTEWLPPFLSGKTTVTEQNVFDALYWYLDGTIIDKNVPMKITLPNGRTRKILYTTVSVSGSLTTDNDKLSEKKAYCVRPVLEIIIQQIFGCFETPRIMGIPVLLKLLSPARRPLQITDDLAGFWKNTWPEICKEMKGRYPKHNWDYRIADKATD